MTSVADDLDTPTRIRGCCVPLPEGRLGEKAAEAAANVFKALADPTRIEMVHFLKAATGPICVCDFTAVFQLSQPTVSHHLGKLRDAGIVSSEKHGIWSFYQLREDMPSQARAAVDAIA